MKKSLKAIKCLVNITTLFAVFAYTLLIGSILYNFVLALLSKSYIDALFTIPLAMFLSVIAYIFVSTANELYKVQKKALKDKQTDETVS